MSDDEWKPDKLKWPQWWYTNPPWEYSDDPTTDDLLRLATDNERESWSEAGLNAPRP